MGEAKRRTHRVQSPQYIFVVHPPWDEAPIEIPFQVHKPRPQFDPTQRAMAIAGLLMSFLQEPTQQNGLRLVDAIGDGVSEQLIELARDLADSGNDWHCELFSTSGERLQCYYSSEELAVKKSGGNYRKDQPERLVKFAGKA